jgi:hypothetical protein
MDPPPCSAAAFEVNSEPRTEARPSVRLRVELMEKKTLKRYKKYLSLAIIIYYFFDDHVHPERENKAILPPLVLEILAPCKAR